MRTSEFIAAGLPRILYPNRSGSAGESWRRSRSAFSGSLAIYGLLMESEAGHRRGLHDLMRFWLKFVELSFAFALPSLLLTLRGWRAQTPSRGRSRSG